MTAGLSVRDALLVLAARERKRLRGGRVARGRRGPLSVRTTLSARLFTRGLPDYARGFFSTYTLSMGRRGLWRKLKGGWHKGYSRPHKTRTWIKVLISLNHCFAPERFPPDGSLLIAFALLQAVVSVEHPRRSHPHSLRAQNQCAVEYFFSPLFSSYALSFLLSMRMNRIYSNGLFTFIHWGARLF